MTIKKYLKNSVLVTKNAEFNADFETIEKIMIYRAIKSEQCLYVCKKQER